MLIDQGSFLLVLVLLGDDVQHVKDIDLILMFELIVGLHYDKVDRSIVKMVVRNLFYKAKISEKYFLFVSIKRNLHEDQLTSEADFSLDFYLLFHLAVLDRLI